MSWCYSKCPNNYRAPPFSLMLGTGNCLVWFGILRYLGFFRTYNVLILTMKGAAPNMFRFLICSSFLYVGFSFAGWVILGKKI